MLMHGITENASRKYGIPLSLIPGSATSKSQDFKLDSIFKGFDLVMDDLLKKHGDGDEEEEFKNIQTEFKKITLDTCYIRDNFLIDQEDDSDVSVNSQEMRDENMDNLSRVHDDLENQVHYLAFLEKNLGRSVLNYFRIIDLDL